jgi:hypothetical protein
MTSDEISVIIHELENIKELANHRNDNDCHYKCHKVIDYCDAFIDKLRINRTTEPEKVIL